MGVRNELLLTFLFFLYFLLRRSSSSSSRRLVELKGRKKKNVRLRSDDKVERAELDKSAKFEILYTDGKIVHAMNSGTFEQVEIPLDLVPEKCRPFLLDNIEVTVSSYEGEPLIVTMPKSVPITVKHTVEQVKGATAKVGAFKEGTLDNDVVLMIPPFTEQGARIEVDPTTWEYVGKA